MGLSGNDLRMPYAFCVELEAVVNIGQARRAFLSREKPPDKFNFLCADEFCRKHRVRVTGVNYRTAAQESTKFRIPYFRTYPGDRHVPACTFFRADTGVPARPGHDSDNEEADPKRRIRRLFTDLVGVFDPRIDEAMTESPGDNRKEQLSSDQDQQAAGGRAPPVTPTDVAR